MNRRFFHSRRVLPPIEIELPHQSSFRQTSRAYPPRTLPANPQTNRPSRPFVRRPPPDLSESASQNSPHTPCRFCYHLIPSDSYQQHLTYCPEKTELQQRNAQQENQQMEIEQPQRPQEEPTTNSDSEEVGHNTLASPESIQQQSGGSNPNSLETYISQEIAPGDIPSLENLESSVSQPMMPEAQDMPSINPVPVFPSVSNEVYNTIQQNLNAEAHPIFPPGLENSNGDNNAQPQENQLQNEPEQPANEQNRPPNGAFVVRTVEQGPNGAPSVRMRVISLDRILGRMGEGITENERPGILGLLSMLAGLQGMHAANFGEFLTLFGNHERGLDREVLEGLPVVTYTHEGFKNVEEESKKCSICLDEYEDEQELRFLWCMHRFHKGCVDQWLERHTNCPFCKKDYADALRASFE